MELERAAAIRVRGLHKTYGSYEAVRGIDFEVWHGEIFALLGPNGAGKTTTVEILEGYRSYDGGEVRVLGVDPHHPTQAWRERLGIVLQTCPVEPELTVRESLELFAGYFPHPLPVDECLALVGLSREADRRAGALSGGQQRRLDFGLGFIGDPEVLFLDEPTTGFDPAARRHAWDVIANLRVLGKTIVLTTHYMDEAQALADRVAIIVQGRILAEGPPGELGGRAERATRVRFRLPAGAGAADLPAALDGAAEVSGDQVELRTAAPARALNALTGWAMSRGIELPDLEVTRPSLEEIYLELTEAQR